MLAFLYGEALPVVNPPYYLLVWFTTGLVFFVVTWVVVVMFYQIVCHNSVGAIEDEVNLVEFSWTFVPSAMVLLFGVFNIWCFSPDYSLSGYESIKIVGRQWYWCYSLPGSDGSFYDSVMGDLLDGVDKPLRLAQGLTYCLYVTSADVIHSFSIPFLSVKVDAIPGRVNQFSFVPDYCGRHVGYCAELCGAGHAYMPIVMEILPRGTFLS